MNLPTTLASLAATACLSHSLSAAVVSYDVPFSGLNVSAEAFSASPNGTTSDQSTSTLQVQVPMFDVNLGTLESVHFVIDLSTNATNAALEVAALGVTINAISLERSLSFTVEGLAGTLGSGTANLGTTTLKTLMGIGAVSIGVGIYPLSNNPAVGNLSSGTLSSPSELTAVSGTGNLTITLSATDGYQYTKSSIGSVTDWYGTTTYAGSATVFYTFTPVPESDHTAILIAGGLAVVLCFKRRSRRQRA